MHMTIDNENLENPRKLYVALFQCAITRLCLGVAHDVFTPCRMKSSNINLCILQITYVTVGCALYYQTKNGYCDTNLRSLEAQLALIH